MLSSEYEIFEDITDAIEQTLADKKIHMECEAIERYERDRSSLYNSGHRKGFNDAIIKYIHKLKSNAGISQADAIIQLVDYFDLSTQDATTLVNEYWR